MVLLMVKFLFFQDHFVALPQQLQNDPERIRVWPLKEPGTRFERNSNGLVSFVSIFCSFFLKLSFQRKERFSFTLSEINQLNRHIGFCDYFIWNPGVWTFVLGFSSAERWIFFGFHAGVLRNDTDTSNLR